MGTESPSQRPYILALDIGANSVGWVCLAAEPAGKGWEPTGLLHPASEMHRWPTLGVRIFKEGVSDFGGGKEEGPGAQRRRARHMRRQTTRRAQRMRRAFRLLQELGLLPDYPVVEQSSERASEAARRDELLKRLDRDLARARAATMPPETAHRAHDLLPYILRTAGLAATTPLAKFELGRAFYHLAQRRGFLSNRKDADRDEEEKVTAGPEEKPRSKSKKSPLKVQMDELQVAIDANGHRSLGEHLLWRVLEKGQRIRKDVRPRRFMYRREFELIWQAQAPHHPRAMTPENKKRLYRAIFRQRPLQDQSHRIGICSLEDGENSWVDEHGVLHKTHAHRRAPIASLIAQRFTSVQRVNDVRILDKTTGERRPFTTEERQRLLRELECRKSMTAAEVGQLFHWSNRKFAVELNFDEKTGVALPGMWTNQQLFAIFGDRWTKLTEDQREAIVLDLLRREDPDWWEEDPDDPSPRERDPVIVRAALQGDGPWSCLTMTPKEARELVAVRMRSEYASHSAVAMRRLLPRMADGVAYQTAKSERYALANAPIRDRLPKVLSVFRTMSNPVVSRSLTELRRVVNQLIAMYGKPAQIRIEVTREVKKGKKGRDRVREAQLENRKQKERAVREHCAQRTAAYESPDSLERRDVERIRLWYEQGFHCPYTVQPIGASQVCSSEMEIDHILPFSRSQDDSFTNKVLVFRSANQQKGQRIPRDAFEASSPERWAKIEAWVRAEQRKRQMSMEKLRRILMTTEDADEHLASFRSRQLNDTGWASSWARKYLMTLYGGDVVNGIDLSGHRRVQACAGEATAHLRRELGLDQLLKEVMDPSTPMPGKWTKRVDQRHHIVDAIAVGWFGPRMSDLMSKAAEKAPEERRRLFAKLPRLTPDLEQAIEAALRACVPSYRVDNRARGPLHKETILSPKAVADGSVKSFVEVGGRKAHRKRLVHESGNHHMVVADAHGRRGDVVRGTVVGQWKAAERLKEQRNANRRDGSKRTSAPFCRPPGTRFTLAINEVIDVHDGTASGSWLARVVKLQQDGRVCVAPVHETRTPRSGPEAASSPAAYIPQEGLLVQVGKLVARGSRKLVVSPIGVVRPCRA